MVDILKEVRVLSYGLVLLVGLLYNMALSRYHGAEG
jgi:hypothetical protein